ncbi:conserved hypothetical protein [Paraburkholderia ribeironis]|uniref:Uncharacterized protein n=1 Tax=Paraburkholderia ribeironis TaxID=1247936 RepID=A0A1N7RN60_9BURK|nr:hypothetical protein [Paraburkholderia ribeironis]SIT36570.1 conserved hypothetical protein [Paraburkholderia ribeironis]
MADESTFAANTGMTKDIKIKEHHLVKAADRHLRSYFQSIGTAYSSCLPANAEQNFFDLGQHCADLVSCVGDWQTLLLEFKVRHEGILPSFDSAQHAGLVVLNNFGIPVEYCFNKSVPLPKASDEAFLGNLLVCEALPLPNETPALTHPTLLQRISSMGSGVPPSLSPLAICDSALYEEERMGQLNTARLLILADGTATHLGLAEGTTLVEMLLADKRWAKEKNLARLQRDIEGLLKSRDKLLQELTTAGWGSVQSPRAALPGKLGEPSGSEKSSNNRFSPF